MSDQHEWTTWVFKKGKWRNTRAWPVKPKEGDFWLYRRVTSKGVTIEAHITEGLTKHKGRWGFLCKQDRGAERLCNHAQEGDKQIYVRPK